MRCQTALMAGRTVPPAPAVLLVHSSGRKELGIRGVEGEVRRGQERIEQNVAGEKVKTSG